MISSPRAKHRDISNEIKTMVQILHPLIVETKVAAPRKTLIIKFPPQGSAKVSSAREMPGEMLKLHKHIPTQRFSLNKYSINSFTSKIRNKSTNQNAKCSKMTPSCQLTFYTTWWSWIRGLVKAGFRDLNPLHLFAICLLWPQNHTGKGNKRNN